MGLSKFDHLVMTYDSLGSFHYFSDQEFECQNQLLTELILIQILTSISGAVPTADLLHLC